MTASLQPQAAARRRPDKRAYYHLFFAQVIALVSTGVATVALALLAYQLAGADAGAVMGTALAIKMLAYVIIAPLAAAFTERLPRRALLVMLDLVRAAVALTLPFVTQIWQIYLLILVFQAASAAFTPACQAIIPDLLPDEQDYARALSRSRLAYEFENLASPALAAGLLLVISFRGLFVGTTIGFLVSAGLILRVTLPAATATTGGGVLQRTTQGLRIFLATPRLRGLLGLNLATAAATAMVTVNTVVLVQAWLGLGERATALAFVAFGAGSVAGAIAVLRYLPRWSNRRTMLAGGAVVAAGLLAGAMVPGYFALLVLWLGLGLGCALAMTPAGSLLLQCAAPADRQPVYAAQSRWRTPRCCSPTRWPGGLAPRLAWEPPSGPWASWPASRCSPRRAYGRAIIPFRGAGSVPHARTGSCVRTIRGDCAGGSARCPGNDSFASSQTIDGCKPRN